MIKKWVIFVNESLYVLFTLISLVYYVIYNFSTIASQYHEIAKLICVVMIVIKFIRLNWSKKVGLSSVYYMLFIAVQFIDVVDWLFYFTERYNISPGISNLEWIGLISHLVLFIWGFVILTVKQISSS